MRKRAAASTFRPKVPTTTRSVERARHVVRFAARAALLCGIGLIGVVGYYVVFSSQFFRVTTLNVEGLNRLAAIDVARRAKVPRAVNIFRVNRAAIAERVSRHPWVAEAVVRRRLPWTLVVRVRERRPLAVLKSTPAVLLDREGMILGPAAAAEHHEYVQISGAAPAAARVGTLVDEKVRSALDLFAFLRARAVFERQQVRRLALTESGAIEVHLQPSHSIVVMRAGDFAGQVERFDAVTSTLGTNPPTRLRIDVTFAGQAVVRPL